MSVRTRSTMVMGRQNMVFSGVSEVDARETALRKFESIMPPSTRPSVTGAVENCLLRRTKPRTPKKIINQTSKNISATSKRRLLQA